jgi:hypothetical protein
VFFFFFPLTLSYHSLCGGSNALEEDLRKVKASHMQLLRMCCEEGEFRGDIVKKMVDQALSTADGNEVRPKQLLQNSPIQEKTFLNLFLLLVHKGQQLLFCLFSASPLLMVSSLLG